MNEVEIQPVTFLSEELHCNGKLYLPGNEKTNLPCVVFANGFSGTMDWILPDFAKRFAVAGIAAFIFDYRFLGESEGEPRQLIDPRNQRTDLRNALQWVRSCTAIDKKKIALWGTSLGGSHVIEIASTDAEIAAVLGNMPAIDAVKGANIKDKAKAAKATTWQIITATLRLAVAALKDVVRSWFGMQPLYLEVYGAAGKAIFTDPSLADRFRKLAAGSATWKNKVAARVLFHLPRYTEGTIERINAPILITLATKDVELNNAFVKQKFAASPSTVIKEYPYDHFSMYHDIALEQVAADQVEFLKKHLLVVSDVTT
jgi:uncharacterized protein